MVKMLFQVTRPYSDNGIPASLHVCILRFIQFYTLLLTAIRCLKLFRIEMPVVTVKLNNRLEAGNKSVNTKLIPYQILRLVLYSQLIKQSVADTLYLVGRHTLLLSIHGYQHFTTFRVGISTGKRAIHYVVLARLSTRWRPLEFFSAYLAGVNGFVSSKPEVKMLFIAKVIFEKFLPGLFNIDFFSAIIAMKHVALPPVNISALFRATRLHRPSHDRLELLTTGNTCFHRQPRTNTLTLPTAKLLIWTGSNGINLLATYSAVLVCASSTRKTRCFRGIPACFRAIVPIWFHLFVFYSYRFIANLAYCFYHAVIIPDMTVTVNSQEVM